MSFMRPMLCGAAAFALLAAFLLQTPSVADDLAKTRFGAVEAPSKGPPRVIGYYSRGCIEGAEALPADGPAWQAMRLSRNRVYGHPSLIDFVETLSRQAPGLGFNGLLIGDLSQPRGGPMLYGHTSHQVGLDVDIWLRQMPKRRLTLEERDTLPFQSVLTADETAVDPDRLSAPLMMVMKAAALDDRVERIFVHPLIKRALCQWDGAGNGADRAFLRKMRPWYGHYEHMHIRLKCPEGAELCRPQQPPPPGDGCGAPLAYWFTDAPYTPKPGAKPKAPITVSALPAACQALLTAH